MLKSKIGQMFGLTKSYCVSQGDTSGDYRKTLLMLCGGED